MNFFESQHFTLPVPAAQDGRGYLVSANICPNCKQLSINLDEGQAVYDENGLEVFSDSESKVIFPKEIKRMFPSEVPQDYVYDFNEALQIVQYSPKASAALSRRLLQKFLRHVLGGSRHNLAEEIDLYLNTNPPEHLKKSIDAIRHVGNFAAHPLRDKESGLIVDVDLEEAQWLLDILEELFEIHFVRPLVDQERRDRLNEKLRRLGKSPIKEGN